MFKAGVYDHIFDVDLGDGMMRKLPYNNGGNALDAAEKFICREGLSKSNVDQIRQFISQHSQPMQTNFSSGGMGGGMPKPDEPEKDNTMR